MLTREETINAFEICRCGAGGCCEDCPLDCKGRGCSDELSSAVLHYLKSDKDKEPAPSANGTSSEVSKDTGSILHIDSNTKSDICQVLASAMSNILGLYQAMELDEKKAFDLGGVYKDICCASAWMSSARKGGDGNEH